MNKKLLTNGQGIIKIVEEVNVKILAEDYIVALANKTKGYTVTKIRIGKDGNEIFLPHPVKYNCEYDSCQKCFDNQKYEPILVTECDDKPFDLYLFCKPDDSSKPTGWAGPGTINPSCDAPGEAICLDLPY
ncbi:hypothetical protein PDM90_02620 [Bacillus cereus]|nr:hypothetical protein [Bacillus cereus]